MALALRGQRDMDTGPQDITEAAVLAQVRRQARKVLVKSILVAAMIVAPALMIPIWR